MSGKRRYRTTAFVAAVLAGVAGLPAIATPARAEESPPAPLTAPRTNEPPAPGEEMLSLRNAYGSTFATEIPGQFRTELHPRPVNFRVNGQWQPIDPTLTQVGTELRQRANSLAVSIPATGAGVSRLAFDSEHSISYGTPIGSLPSVAAVVDSSVATLPGLLTGSDLRYESRWNGVKTDIVLRSPSAPTSFTFPLVTQGLTASLDGSGNIRFTDAAGLVRAVTPHGYMTDANVDPRSGDPVRSEGVAYQLVNVAGVQALKVTLDANWVHASDRQWPITVDPTLVTYAADTDDMFVQQPYTNDYSADVELKAGTFNGGTDKARSFLHFAGVNALDGKVINSAYFKPYEFHSYSCTRTNVSVYRITGAWAGTGNRTYPGPAVSDKIFTVSEARGYSSACPAARITFNVSGLVRNWASNTWVNNGLAIIADSETDSFGWKKFDSRNGTNDPQLEVTWSEPNRAPGQVFGRSVGGNVCACAPGLTADSSPAVTGSTTDADGDTIKYYYEIYPGYLTTVDASGNATVSGVTAAASGSTAFLASGAASSYTPPILGDGQYSYRVRAYDGALFGVWSSGWAQFTIDATAPGTGIDSSTHPTQTVWYSNSSPSVVWGSTSESGVQAFSYVLDQTSTTVADTIAEPAGGAKTYSNLADGVWYFHARAESNVNLWGPTATFTLKIDTTAPNAPASISSSSHNPGTVSSNRNVTANWTAGTDATSGVAGYSYTFNNSPTTATDTSIDPGTTTATSSALSDGTWYFHILSVDAAGNASADKAYGPFIIDGTGPNAPVIASTTHPDQSDSAPWSTNRHADFTWVAADANPIAGYAVSFDTNISGDPGNTVSQTSSNFSIDTTADRLWYLHVRAFDAAGNAGAVGTFRIRIDTTPSAAPQVVSTNADGSFADGASPAGRFWSNNSPSLSWSATDVSALTGSNINGYSFAFDQAANTDPGMPPTPGNTTTLSRTGLADGTYYLHVRARNGSNLWSPTAHFSVKVDTTSPTGAIPTSPSHNTVDAISVNTVRTDWTASPGSDATSGIAGYSYSFTAAADDTADSTVDTTATTRDTTLADGTYYFHLRTLDNAGNPSDATFGPIRISQSAPPVSDTDKSRFVSLWKPRALSETYYQDWFANPIPPSVLAEGFHAMTDVQKHYLADQLWAAVMAGQTSDAGLDPAGKEAMYLFVFDKDKAAHPDNSAAHYPAAQNQDRAEDSTPNPTTESPGITDLYATRLLRSAPALSSIAAILETVPVDLPIDVEGVASLPTVDVSSALGGDAQAASDALDVVTDGLDTVTGQLTDADTQLGEPGDTRAIFAATDRLPIGYTVCWDTASYDNCKDAGAVGVSTDIDVTNDGSSDLTVTFGPTVPANPLGGTVPSLANVQLDVKRYSPLLPAPAAPQSDLQGQPVRAHVWVLYDIPSSDPSNAGAGTRLRLGVDGYQRGERLSEATKATAAINDPAVITTHDFNIGLDVKHTWPDSSRPKIAITAGLQNTSGNTDPIAAALTYTQAVDFTGTIKLLNDDVAPATSSSNVDRTLAFTADTAVPTRLTIDATGVIDRLSETTVTNAAIDDLKAGSTFTLHRTYDGTTDHQDISVGNALPAAANQRNGRLSGRVRVTRDGAEDLTTFDLRTPARSFTVNGISTGQGGFDVQYNNASGDTPGRVDATIRRTDRNHALQLALRLAGSSLPATVHAAYGKSTTDDRTLITVTNSARTADLSVVGYDRGLRLAISAAVQQLSKTLAASVSPGLRHFDVTAGPSSEPGIGLLDAVAVADGGAVSRRSGEHAVVSISGNAIGASIRLHGLRAASLDRPDNDHIHVTGSVDSQLAQPVTVAGSLDGLRFSGGLSSLPESLDATLDLSANASIEIIATPSISRASVYGMLPGKARVDAVLRGLPTRVKVTGSLDEQGAVLGYSANGRLTAIDRFMATLDPTSTDRSGTTLSGSATDLPQALSATLSRSLRSFDAKATDGSGQPDHVGSLTVQAARGGAEADVPQGQHLTLTGTPTAFAISGQVDNVVSAQASIAPDLAHGSANVRLSAPTGPFTVHYNVDTIRLLASTTSLPETLDLDATNNTPTIHLTSSRSIAKVSGYIANTQTGPTVRAVLEGTPLDVKVDATIADPSYGLKYTSSGPTGRAAGFFSTKYVPVGVTPTTEFVSVDASATTAPDGTVSGLPANFTATFNQQTRQVTWRNAQRTGQIKFAGSGALLGGLNITGVARGIPGDFDATLANNVKLFDGRGNTVDYLLLRASNHAQPPGRLPGRHVLAYYDLANGNLDASVELDNVSGARVVTGDKSVMIEGGANTPNVLLQAKVRGLVPDDGSNRFLLALDGHIDQLPPTLTISAQEGKVIYDSSSHVSGDVTASVGWDKALEQTPDTTEARSGAISFTDASCSSDCNATEGDHQRFFCSQSASRCYAVRAKLLHQALPKHIAVTFQPAADTPLVEATGLASGSLSVKGVLRHFISTPTTIGLTQNGITEDATLSVSNLVLAKDSGGNGIAVRGKLTTSGLNGDLTLYASQDTAYTFGPTSRTTYRLSAPRVDLNLTNVPATVDINGVIGRSTDVKINTAASIAKAQVNLSGTLEQFDQNGNPFTVLQDSDSHCTDAVSFCASVALKKIPAAPSASSPIRLRASIDKYTDGSKVVKVPKVTFNSPAPGMDLSIKIDRGIAVLADLDPDIYFTTTRDGELSAKISSAKADFTGLASNLQVVAAPDSKDVLISSWPEATGKVELSTPKVDVLLSGSEIAKNPYSAKLVSLAMKFSGTFQMNLRDQHLEITDVRSVALTLAKYNLAFGIAGTYGQMRLYTGKDDGSQYFKIGNFRIAPGLTLNPNLPWAPDLFPVDIPIPGSGDSTAYYGEVIQADERGQLGPCLGGVLTGSALSMRLYMTPWPTPDKPVVPNQLLIKSAGGRQIATFNPFGKQQIFGTLFGLAMATAYNPYDNFNLDVDFGGPFGCV